MQADQLQTADIILTSRSFSSSPVSGVIKIGTLSKYSHAMVYVGNGYVFEAISEGVVRRPVIEAIQGCDARTAFRHTAATEEQRQQIISFVESKKDGAYGVPGVLSGSGLAVAAFAGIAVPLMIGRSINNAVTEAKGGKRSYFCSELVADAYRSAGLPLGIYGRTPSFMNPGDIGEYSQRNPTILQKLGEVE